MAGERPQHRRHYLKGSVYCRECDLRLTYGVSTGRNGAHYPYFFCSSRVNQTPHKCAGDGANLRPDLIEDGIQKVYESDLLNLGADDLRSRIEAVERLMSVSQQASELIRVEKTRRVEKLRSQQSRLLRLQIEEGDRISSGAFREERARLDDEIATAERSLTAAEARLTFDGRVLKMALELVESVALVYDDSREFLRRAYNQAFFSRVKVKPRRAGRSGPPKEAEVSAELAGPFDLLLAPDFVIRAHAEASAIERSAAQETESGPLSGAASNSSGASASSVSIFEVMAEREGFEPSKTLPPYTRSRRASSTTPASLQAPGRGRTYRL